MPFLADTLAICAGNLSPPESTGLNTTYFRRLEVLNLKAMKTAVTVVLRIQPDLLSKDITIPTDFPTHRGGTYGSITKSIGIQPSATSLTIQVTAQAGYCSCRPRMLFGAHRQIPLL